VNSTRVTHIVLGLEVGGLERVVVNLARGLQQCGCQNTVVCLEREGPFNAELEAAGIPVVALGKKNGLDTGAIRQLATLLRRRHVQIIHTHNPAPHAHGIAAALLAGVPVRVHTKHGRNYPHMRGRVLLNRALSWFTDAIVAVSDDARDVALHIEKAAPAKVRRIWNGVDTDSYKRNAQRPTSNTQHPTIGTVARLSPEKDQNTMLAAFKLVQEKLPQARLVFVGDGPSATGLKQTAADLGIAANVDFLGMRSDVAELLHTFDLFTLSSISEGISMTLLEAMACEIPGVATDVGGNREILNPPECGLIVPARDPRSLADAYLELLRDPSRRAAMGRAARQRVVGHFSLQAMVRHYQQLYEELLRTKGVAA
jgi:sugar transferase (PEP-CTERM/EpsH1 system associated)